MSENRPDLRLVERRSATRLATNGNDVDRALVRAALGGSRIAWQDLVDRHLADVWAQALEASSSREEAELLGRLVWLRLAQSLPWVVVDPVGTWLRRAVQDEAARLRRASARPGLRSVRPGPSADSAASAGLPRVGPQRRANER